MYLFIEVCVMDKSSVCFLKTVYFLGVAYGIFTFSFNSTSKRFQLWKNVKIINNIILLMQAVCAVGITYVYQTEMIFENMVIQISTPMNFLAMMLIVAYASIGVRLQERKVLELLNTALDITDVITKNNQVFYFSRSLFLTNFAFDVLFLVIRSFFLCYNLLNMETSLLPYVITLIQTEKGICFLFTHIYMFCLNYLTHLLTNVEIGVKRSIKEFENFLQFNSRCSKHQMILKCCQLSDQLDFYFIQSERILSLTKKVQSLFYFHILLFIIHNMTDVLSIVSNYYVF